MMLDNILISLGAVVFSFEFATYLTSVYWVQLLLCAIFYFVSFTLSMLYKYY